MREIFHIITIQSGRRPHLSVRITPKEEKNICKGVGKKEKKNSVSWENIGWVWGFMEREENKMQKFIFPLFGFNFSLK